MSILNFKNKELNKTFLAVSVLGKSLKLNIKYDNTAIINLNKKDTEIDLILPKSYRNLEKSSVINTAIKKLYSEIASIEIEYAMEIARHILGFAPEDYVIKEITDSFYKCKNDVIIINPDIVQYNREIINTTIIQAFCKSKFRVNSSNYKNALQNGLLRYEEYKFAGYISRNAKFSA